jgi:uncharacterized Ntn-hydrolase superfamily protein
MTFSIVARCAGTGMVGVAIASSSPAVAARCVWTRAGVGAVATQNVTDPRLGPRVLDLMAAGLGAAAAVAEAAAGTPFAEWRQLLAVDAGGGTGLHSGRWALGVWAGVAGESAVAGGNLLASEAVPAAMLAAFAASSGHLGDRLIAALRAGRDAGGEAGPVHSAGLEIAHEQPWPLVDLRCDWTEGCPVEAVAAAWAVYRPQVDAYVQRALDPAAAPSYGVPGDEGAREDGR